MLGIRRYKGVALDLFQGELRLFACDAVIDYENLGLGLHAADLGGKRHVALVGQGEPGEVFEGIQSYLQASRPAVQGIGRISVVLDSLDRYYEYQEVLFRTFPDEA